MASIPLLLSLIVHHHKHRVLQPTLREGGGEAGCDIFPIESAPGRSRAAARDGPWSHRAGLGPGGTVGAAVPRLSPPCPLRWCHGLSRWLSPGPLEVRGALCGHPEICHRPSLPLPGGARCPLVLLLHNVKLTGARACLALAPCVCHTHVFLNLCKLTVLERTVS